MGATDMLTGLEHRHDNIVRLRKELALGITTDKKSMYHQAVAYVTRLGQIYYFAISKFVEQAGCEGTRKVCAEM